MASSGKGKGDAAKVKEGRHCGLTASLTLEDLTEEQWSDGDVVAETDSCPRTPTRSSQTSVAPNSAQRVRPFVLDSARSLLSAEESQSTVQMWHLGKRKKVFAKCSDVSDILCQLIKYKFDRASPKWYTAKRADLDWTKESMRTPTKRKADDDASAERKRQLLLRAPKKRKTRASDKVFGSVRRRLFQSQRSEVPFPSDVYVIDLETTGTNPQMGHVIVELAVAKINGSLHGSAPHKVQSVFHCYVDANSYPSAGRSSHWWRKAWIFGDGQMDTELCAESGFQAAAVRSMFAGFCEGKRLTSYNRYFDVCQWLEQNPFWRIAGIQKEECIMRCAEKHLGLESSPKLKYVYDWAKDQLDMCSADSGRLLPASQWKQHSAVGDAIVAAQLFVFIREQQFAAR